MDYIGVDNLEVMSSAKNYNNFLLKEIIKASGGARTALDFGAGTGTFETILMDKGFKVSCVEADDALLARLAGMGCKTYASVSDAPPQKYIFSLNVLEHIEDDAAISKVIHDSLAKKGIFFMYVPAFPLLFSSMDRKVNHFRRYRLKPTVKMLQEAGFEIQSARYVDTMGFCAALAYRFVGNRKGDLNPHAVKFFDRVIFPLNTLLDPLFAKVLGKNLAIVARRVS